MSPQRGTSLLAAVLLAGTPGRPGAVETIGRVSLPTTPLAEHEWLRLRRGAEVNRVTGSVLAAVLDGALPTTDEQFEELTASHMASMATAVRLDRQLVRVVGLLGGAGVDVVSLKGPAVAHLDYDAPWHRAYGDIDVLLRAEQIDVAYPLLEAAGYERPAARLRSDFDRRFGKGATFVGADGLELDVHRTFVFGALGVAIDPDDLFGAVDHFTVGGVDVSALDTAHRYLHACYHAAVGNSNPRWSTLLDVVQLHPTEPAVARQVLATALRWGGMVVVARAHELVAEALEVRLLGPVATAAAAYEPSTREERAIRTYVGRRRSFALQVLAALPFLPTTADRVAFLRAAAVPEEDSIRTRGSEGRLAWLRRGLRSLSEGFGS